MTGRAKTPRVSLAVSAMIPEVQALLAGRKTLFTVPAKHAPEVVRGGRWRVAFSRSRVETFATRAAALEAMPRPFWPGRSLHVREVWAPMLPVDPRSGERVVARYGLVHRTMPDGDRRLIGYAASTPRDMEWVDDDGYATEKNLWRSAAAMPRWASRILVTVTGSSLARLHDITADGIDREGVLFGDDNPFSRNMTQRQRYELAWSTRYGATYPWKSNPQVWCVETKTLDIATPDDEPESAR